MAAVTEADLLAAIQMKFMTAAETISADFTPVGAPSFEGSTSAFPNGRTEKFVDFSGSGEYYTFDPSAVANQDSGIMHIWIKPDFTQTAGTNYHIQDFYNAINKDTLQLSMVPAYDDWFLRVYRNNVQVTSLTTTGETWSVDDRIHMVLMWDNAAGLEGGKSCKLYIDNVLAASQTTTWAAGGTFHTTSKLGAQHTTALTWDGGMFDYALLDYDALIASYTEAEIVQSLYDNSADMGGGTHIFAYELSAPLTTPGLTIQHNKVRIVTDSSGVPTTALEIDDSQNANFAGTLDVAGQTDITDNTASTSGGTGALVVTGGVGIGGRLSAANGASIGDGAATNTVETSGSGVIIYRGTAGVHFGSCTMYEGGWTQATAVQNTWYNVSDVDFVDGQLNTITHDGSGKLTTDQAGRYLCNVSIDWENNTVNDHIEIGFEVNGSGSAQTEGIVCSETKFANEEHIGGTTAILDIGAGETLEVCIRTTDNNTPTLSVNCVNLNMMQIGGT